LDRIAQLLDQLDQEAYVADPAIATSLHLALELRKPLLVEGTRAWARRDRQGARALLGRT